MCRQLITSTWRAMPGLQTAAYINIDMCYYIQAHIYIHISLSLSLSLS